MATKAIPTSDVLRQLLRYEPETGKLFWKPKEAGPTLSTRHAKIWNSSHAGKEAFTSASNTGYRQGTVNGQVQFAHRVIWLMVTGEVPDRIDHINGDRQDNRLSNLRNVSHSMNLRNSKLRLDNTSGYPGVSWKKGKRRWSVRIGIGSRDKHIGQFAALEDAISARKAAEAEYGYHANHGR